MSKPAEAERPTRGHLDAELIAVRVDPITLRRTVTTLPAIQRAIRDHRRVGRGTLARMEATLADRFTIWSVIGPSVTALDKALQKPRHRQRLFPLGVSPSMQQLTKALALLRDLDPAGLFPVARRVPRGEELRADIIRQVHREILHRLRAAATLTQGGEKTRAADLTAKFLLLEYPQLYEPTSVARLTEQVRGLVRYRRKTSL